MDFIEELSWRGMIQDVTPGLKEQLAKEMTTAYVGIDPTADSLHIGHLVSVMMLRHLQRAGHRPVVLVGGATGMIGDPSGKSLERNLLDEKTLRHNQDAIKKQLSSLIDFDSSANNAALMVNNYDWMKEFTFLDFARDVGKRITVNYMMAKDSVKKRFSGEGDGMSFTEFTYQLVQGFDYLHLYQEVGCRLQMGGSDQWGNITTGTELIRRKLSGEAWGLTCPLIKKADGTKFGKTETGNIWLSAEYTSPYKFYQFWLGTSDQDAERYIKIFTFLDKLEIEQLIDEHRANPHLRLLQKRLAEQITLAIHGQQQLDKAIAASEILFGGNAAQGLRMVDEATILEVFEGVPQFNISRTELQTGVPFSVLCTEKAAIFASRGELRRLIQGGGISLCGQKITDMEQNINSEDLISERFLLVQKGKKSYNLIIVS
ncbi:MAG: tyrosine--tRNA ligase [Mucinivorans sp.]